MGGETNGNQKIRISSRQEWLGKVRDCCKDIRHPREGKTVYVGASWKDISYKTDMDVERLPSGKFETNELVLRHEVSPLGELALISYNILRMIGQESLKHKQADKHPVKRRRIRTVLSNLIQFASHITEHARKVFLGMGCSNTWRYFRQ